jgi:O-antigen ligase
VGTGILTTILVNPWFAFDPINLPKMVALSTGAAFLLGVLLTRRESLTREYYPIIVLAILFTVSQILSFFVNSAPWYQQLWGTWGRSTGLISYISFTTITVAALLMSSTEQMRLTRVSFERLGYFMTLYTLLQLMDLDPINWSQKIMIATLGNINFMSSFLGLTAISYSCRFLLEKSALSAKLYFASLTSLNLYLIYVSESIQGIGVYFAGLTLLLTFKIRQSFKFAQALLFFVLSLVFGILGLLGTAGFGPLSLLKQETVLFRLDYWQAGINMVLANPLNGVGVDSYGDFYREFRTLEAVTRTGPQRITNTAHNIFLDIFAGSGVFAGIIFTLMMIVTAKAILSGLKNNFLNHDFIASGSIWLGFMVFCSISINQIGVGVWGFIFTGLVNGFAIKYRIEKKSSKNSLASVKRGTKSVLDQQQSALTSVRGLRSSNKASQIAASGILSITVATLSLIPNVADARFISAIRSSNLDLAMEVVKFPGIQDFHTEKLISDLAEAGRSEESLELAQLLVKQNPQSWSAWVAIVSSGIATRDQRVTAANELFRLDPNNDLVKKEINAALFP